MQSVVGPGDLSCGTSGSAAGGFTLVELLVVIAIIAILVITLSPALVSLREMSRRAECTQRAGRLALALQQYELAHESFPSRGH